jgi:hypothetical protein
MADKNAPPASPIGAFEIAILVIAIVVVLGMMFPALTGSIRNGNILSNLFYYTYKLVLMVLPFVLVIFLGRIAWKVWVHYVQQDFISGITWTMLEIIPPRDVLQSPKAMETFLATALYHWSEKGGKEEFWQGAVWFWFSLEIASINGQVHFYIRTPSRVKTLIETQMYAQYPQAQVREVEDYTLAVDAISPQSSWMGWGCEFKLRKSEAFPLSTYVDFGLDKDPKEEYKIDPISPIVEFFGSLQKGEQAWIQIVITPKILKRWHTPGTWFGTHDWITESRRMIMEINIPYTRYHKGSGPGGTDATEIRQPDFFKNVVAGMTEKTSKLGFETGIRVMYIAKKEAWNMNNRRNIRLIFRQFAKPDSNELWRHNSTQGDALGSSLRSLSPIMNIGNGHSSVCLSGTTYFRSIILADLLISLKLLLNNSSFHIFTPQLLS